MLKTLVLATFPLLWVPGPAQATRVQDAGSEEPVQDKRALPVPEQEAPVTDEAAPGMKRTRTPDGLPAEPVPSPEPPPATEAAQPTPSASPVPAPAPQSPSQQPTTDPPAPPPTPKPPPSPEPR